MFLNLISWIALGLVAGLVAAKFVDQRDDDPKLGVMFAAAGAAICGFIYAVCSAVGVNAFNARSLWAAAAGAAAGIVGWHLIRRLGSRA
jgi:uncharacterized membrane protein YeaQ/YmgE (transglycosylase-associated protein family)